MKAQKRMFHHHSHHHDHIRHSVRVDMIHGPLLGPILKFAIPVALGAMLQQLFNAVDVAVIGRFDSSEALAAVGSNTSLISLFVNLFVGISIGTGVTVARYFGQGEKKRIPAAVHTSMLLALIAGVVLMAVVLVVGRSMLQLMGSPDNVIGLAVIYLRLYALGMPFIMIYNFGSAILRSVGDSRRPLYCLIVSGIVNACLNLFFVIVLEMSVTGVALATVIANVINAVMILRFLTTEEEPVRLDLRRLGIDKKELARILRIGVPAGLQGMVFSISNVTIQSSVNSFGADAIAGSAVAFNFDIFCFYMVTGFVQAAVNFTGQNYGAGRPKRCRRVFGLCLLAAFSASLLLSLVFLFGRGFFIGIFTKDAAVIPYAVVRLKRVLTLYCLVSTYEVASASLRGMGYSMTPSVITIFGTCVLRILWVMFVIPHHHSFELLVTVYPVSWIVTGTLMILAWFVFSRKAFDRIRTPAGQTEDNASK